MTLAQHVALIIVNKCEQLNLIIMEVMANDKVFADTKATTAALKKSDRMKIKGTRIILGCSTKIWHKLCADVFVTNAAFQCKISVKFLIITVP